MAAELKAYDIYLNDGRKRIGMVRNVAEVEVEHHLGTFDTFTFWGDALRTNILGMFHDVRIAEYCEPLPEPQTVSAEA